MNKRVVVAPSLTVVLLFFIATGRFVDYTIIVSSLLAHEAGHLLAAKLVQVPILHVRFHIYGGEITFKPIAVNAKQNLIIACGGPFVTLLIWLFFFNTNFIISPYIVNVQKWILLLNILPIWPLDGGRIVVYSWKMFINENYNSKRYIYFSCMSSIFLAILAFCFHLPFVTMLLLFVSIQAWQDYKNWSLKYAFESIVLSNK